MKQEDQFGMVGERKDDIFSEREGWCRNERAKTVLRTGLGVSERIGGGKGGERRRKRLIIKMLLTLLLTSMHPGSVGFVVLHRWRGSSCFVAGKTARPRRRSPPHHSHSFLVRWSRSNGMERLHSTRTRQQVYPSHIVRLSRRLVYTFSVLQRLGGIVIFKLIFRFL